MSHSPTPNPVTELIQTFLTEAEDNATPQSLCLPFHSLSMLAQHFETPLLHLITTINPNLGSTQGSCGMRIWWMDHLNFCSSLSSTMMNNVQLLSIVSTWKTNIPPSQLLKDVTVRSNLSHSVPNLTLIQNPSSCIKRSLFSMMESASHPLSMKQFVWKGT
jgi:hypothetical protein